MSERNKRVPVDERRVSHIRQLPEQIRLVQEENGQDESRIYSASEAWNLAQQVELDLILVNNEAKPPVYRMANWGKFLYAEQKHQKEMAKANRANLRTLKECRINQNVGPADYARILSRVKEWLPHHDVKLEVIMKGFRGQPNRLALPRGMDQSEAYKWPDFILNRVLNDLQGVGRADRMSSGFNGISVTVKPT